MQTMDALNARLDEMMRMLTEEREQRRATEETLRQTQARLDAATSQQNPTLPQQVPPPPAPTSLVLAKPQPFKGSRGALAEAFIGQIYLHTVTYPERFPTDSSKVAFAVSFMTDYAATWSQPYLNKVCSGEAVVFSEFIDDFQSSFFDHNRRHHAEVALRNLRQTGTVASYTQDFNLHARTVGWPDGPLMSLYQNGLKENIQLAVVMSNIEFTSLLAMQAMAMKAGQTIEGIRHGRPTITPIPSTSTSAPDPNAMDLSALQRTPNNRLSDAERARRAELNLCFRCGQAGHVSRGCLNGGRKSQGRQKTSSSARISELQAEINRIRTSNTTSTPEGADSSKNGGAQV